MNLTNAQSAAVAAALKAGRLIAANQFKPKIVNARTRHDIKLELDVRCQKLIERSLQRDFPGVALLGEEGIVGDAHADWRWVVDPIDGTVNFTYGIPHVAVSIALQQRAVKRAKTDYADGYRTLVGVVYDPFTRELWTAIRGRPARLNGRIVRVSNRRTLAESIVSVGFAKSPANLDKTLPYFNWLAPRIRKIRMLGAAALGLTYVASGRFDAYVERGIRLWDIAAGGLILECAGGDFRRDATDKSYSYRMVASNGRLPRLRMPE